MDAHALFEAHRPLLFSIAYRMLGSVVDAEDAVQETWLRWQSCDLAAIQNPKAYLLSIVTRWSIDQLRSARRQRETYVGTWLPEPLVERQPSPADQAELAESLSMAFLVLLETLSPQERAVYLLHDVFAYPFRDIGNLLGKSEAACRQLGKRARGRLHGWKSPAEPAPPERQRLAEAFLAAVAGGDVDGLRALLTEDARCHSDHGGKAAAAHRTIHTADKVARFLVGVSQRFPPADPRVELVPVNGVPGLVIFGGDTPVTALTFAFEMGRISEIFMIRNPDKLKGVAPRAQ